MKPVIGLVAALLLSTSAQAAKTLIVNANGYTFQQDGKLKRFSTLLIGDDGKVMAALSKGASEPKLVAGDYKLDANGKTIIPGLIDAHGQIMRLALSQRQLDLSGAASLAEAQDKIAQQASKDSSTGWLYGNGWDQSLWGGTFPTAADLDKAHAVRPVWLKHADGQAGWANSAALKAAGITKASKDPAGGRIVRDALGNPTGVLVNTAMQLVEAVAVPPSAGERELALEALLKQLPAVGLTAVQDMGTSAQDWALFRSFGDSSRLTFRIIAYADGMTAMEAISPLRPTRWLYDDKLRLQGVKIAADGALASRGAWLLASYADDPKNSGLQQHDNTRLKNLLSRANYFGYQAVVNATGDAAVREAIDAYAEIVPTYGEKFRNRIEHIALIDPVDVPRMAELKLVATVMPAANSPYVAARLGAERAALAYPLQSLDKAKITVALGSAFPTGKTSPLYSLSAAGQARAGEALNFQEALKAMTLTAAFAGNAESRIGMLEPDRWADFLILEKDPFTLPPEEWKGLTVEETWLGGRRVYQKGSRQP